MKTLMIFILLLLAVITVQAQERYALYTDGLQPKCADILTIEADAAMSYSLVVDDVTLVEGVIAAGSKTSLKLSRPDQWYILWMNTDGVYRIDVRVDCPQDSETDPQQAEHEAQLRAIWQEAAPQLQAALTAIFENK